MTKVENALDAINSRLDTAKEKISELETQQQELSKMKHRKKLGKKKGTAYQIAVRWLLASRPGQDSAPLHPPGNLPRAEDGPQPRGH